MKTTHAPRSAAVLRALVAVQPFNHLLAGGGLGAEAAVRDASRAQADRTVWRPCGSAGSVTLDHPAGPASDELASDLADTLRTVRTLVHVARILLGLMFLVFGLNGFFHFMPAPRPAGIAGQYCDALSVSHILAVVFTLEIGAGGCLLADRFVRAALTVLAPILVNIVLFHVCLAPDGLPPAVIAVALWSVLFYRERAAFSALWAEKGLA